MFLIKFQLFFLMFGILLVNIYSQSRGSCLTPHRESGTCIPFKNCPQIYLLTNKPLLSNEERNYIISSQCGYDNENLVCCPISSQPVSNENNANLPEPGICGVQTIDKIYGGEKAFIGEFPWMALLEYSKPQNQRGFYCGGALINEKYVLTAAHCINGIAIPRTFNLFSVRLGELDLNQNPDCEENEHHEVICATNFIDVEIEQKIPHESYVPRQRAQTNDIGLLKLVRSVQYTDFVKPICLPTSINLKNQDYENVVMWVSGWGRTELVQESNVLLKVKLKGYNKDQCRDLYRSLNINLQDTQMCIGGEKGKDSCTGDSGGPVITKDTSASLQYYYIASLVSFGPNKCGTENRPGVYTVVEPYIPWILSKIV